MSHRHITLKPDYVLKASMIVSNWLTDGNLSFFKRYVFDVLSAKNGQIIVLQFVRRIATRL